MLVLEIPGQIWNCDETGFNPPGPLTAREDPRPLYHLWRHWFYGQGQFYAGGRDLSNYGGIKTIKSRIPGEKRENHVHFVQGKKRGKLTPKFRINLGFWETAHLSLP